MSDFLILEHPILSPTECFRCHSPTGPVLDFGFDLPAYGRPYLCMTCVELLTRKVGYATPVTVADLEARLRSMTSRCGQLEHELKNKKTKVVPFEEALAAMGQRLVPIEEPVTEPVAEPPQVVAAGPWTPRFGRFGSKPPTHNP